MVTHGTWIDDHPKKVLTAKYFDELQDLGLSSIAIMVDTSRKPWDPTWKPKQIERAARLAEPRRMEIILTTWPWPVRQIIDRMYKDLQRLVKIAPGIISAHEADMEFNWKTKRVEGFPSIDVAGDYIVSKFHSLRTDRHCDCFMPYPNPDHIGYCIYCDRAILRFELTTFAQHVENGITADVSPHMNRLLCQAYSVATRKRNINGIKTEVPIRWGHTYGPGRMQRMSLDRTLLVPGVDNGAIELGCGLAAWNQQWPNKDPLDAMQTAYDMAMKYNCKEIRWWSSKWILGKLSNLTPYAGTFLRQLKKNK
jgi:hypothetical protein